MAIAQRLLAQGMRRFAYVQTGDKLTFLVRDDESDPGFTKPYEVARDYIRDKTGVRRVMWHRDGIASPHGGPPPHWAEIVVGDEIVGWATNV